MSLEQRIIDGISGKFEGLHNGLDRINQYIFGLQRKCLYLIGGQSGTYKTTLVDFMIMNALRDAQAKGIPLDIDYYSFEIDEITKQCNWLSVISFLKYDRVISPEKIKGLGTFRLDKEEQEIIEDCIPDLKELWSKINFIFTPVNPTGAYLYLWKKAEEDGKILFGDSYTNGEGETKRKVKGYIPNDPNKYRVVVTDHIYYWKKERGFSTKEVLDKWGEFCVELRNMFGYTFVNIQQFNRSLSSIERQKYKGVDISPQESDFKDTGNLYQDKQ